jgi:hypothetical protein
MPEVRPEHFTAADLEAARRQAVNPAPLPTDWEGEASAAEAVGEMARLLNGDNDTAHYLRGNTLVLHIFVSHTGGTWSEAERNTVGAQARVAKEWLRSRGPAGANIHWDYDGTDVYSSLQATVDSYIPWDGMTYGLINQILTSWGFVDSDGDGAIIDEFTLYMQQEGGWDNVMTCWQPRQTGRAWAGLGLAYSVIYFGDTAGVLAHEWGHMYGFCDEYVEGGHCDGGIDCGPCANAYLPYVPDNSNCALPQCPSQVDCVMRTATLNNVCAYTHDGWGWRDGNNDGYLDEAKRYLPGGGSVLIYEVPCYGWFYWNDVTNSEVVAQSTTSWGVIGLRSPWTADYDMTAYADNNHNFQLGSSAYGTGDIDFVVGDYNHAPVGNEHIQLTHYSGDWSNYSLDVESGEEILYPDGIPRTEIWDSAEIVRVYDVPLFAGERVRFTLTTSEPTLDLGMALFRSDQGPYWVGRAGAQWEADVMGMGGMEEIEYTVSQTDIYGLVLFANTAVTGGYTVRVGGWPVTLVEETTVGAGGDLQLYNYDPNAVYWSFVGVQPQPSTDVRLTICNDANYQEWRGDASDAGAGGMEFIAADYNHAPLDRDFLRVNLVSGGGNHMIEWEHGPDMLWGISQDWWTGYHHGKVWDAYMNADQPYFIRQYHDPSAAFDTGLFLMSSADGGLYKSKSMAAAESDSRPAASGGEWFSYTPTVTDYYGVVLDVNNPGGTGSYSIMFGPKETLAEDAAVTRPEPVVWGRAAASWNYWGVYAVRPSSGDQASIWLYGDDAYTSTSMYADDQTGSAVSYVVGDFNHAPSGIDYYPRFLRTSGGTMSMEWECGADQLSYTPGQANEYNLIWDASDVAQAWDVYIDGTYPGGRSVCFEVTDVSGGKDFGIAVYASNGATYFANASSARATADESEIGGTETVTVNLTQNDWYGFVVYNKTETGGAYRVRVSDAGASSIASAEPAAFRLRAVTENPFPQGVRLELSLRGEEFARLVIYDVNGREVKRLIDGAQPAGIRPVDWDGTDAAGQAVSAGVYFAQLTAGRDQTRLQLVRSR